MPKRTSIHRSRGRTGPHLQALQELLGAPVDTLAGALTYASTKLAVVLEADKVDVFLLEPATNRLVAFGTSETPLGAKQREEGLHELPLSNGGRAVEVFVTGQPRHDGHVDRDAGE